jgi:hypothetical protein
MAALVLLLGISTAGAQVSPPDNVDLRTLQVSEGIVQLFRQFPDSVWPGYDLAERPFVIYRPGEWALLLGYLHDTAEFSAYPLNWPDLGHPVRFHEGEYGNMIGQIVFDFPLDDTLTVAVPVPDAVPEMAGLERLSYEEYVFGFIVHEAFHQYQYEAFGEIPWEREERYPILNVENTANAVLEMRLLADALGAVADDDKSRCKDLTRMFGAVRKHRWGKHADFVGRFEQGLEIREGTAKYVEVKALDLVKGLSYHSDVPASPPLPDKMGDVTALDLLRTEFEARILDGSVSPEDMPRNRVYPVGAAQGLLLDYFGVDWKDAAQRAGYDFSMADLLIERLAVEADSLPGLLVRARSSEAFGDITQATERLIQSYLTGCRRAFREFEERPGRIVEVKTKRSGVSRSRSTSERKWLMNEGRFQLCLGYEVYSLSSHDLLLQVEDSALLEKNDWDAGIRTVTMIVDGDLRFELDDRPAALLGRDLPEAESRDGGSPGSIPERGPDPEPGRGGSGTSDDDRFPGSRETEGETSPALQGSGSRDAAGEGDISQQPAPDLHRDFKEIELSAEGLFLKSSLPGTVVCRGDTVRIDLTGE